MLMCHCCHPFPAPPSPPPQVIWLSCLPLGLFASVGWGTVPLTVVISFLLLGIEEIGVAIEEVRLSAWGPGALVHVSAALACQGTALDCPSCCFGMGSKHTECGKRALPAALANTLRQDPSALLPSRLPPLPAAALLHPAAGRAMS